MDGTCLVSRRGYGRFLHELLPELLRLDDGHRYTLIVDRAAAEAAQGFRPVRQLVVDTSEAQGQAASARGSRGVRDMLRMGLAAGRARLDVMFFPTVYSFFPVLSRTPVAVAFHDTIADRHGDVVFPDRRTRAMWNAKVRLAIWQARTVITVSGWSRDRLCERFGLSRERIHVVEEAAARVFRPVDDDEPRRRFLQERGIAAQDPYFLYVGGLNPHKNLLRLVEAFARSMGDSSAARLLLVGDHTGDVFHADVAALRGAIATSGLNDRVTLLGYVADEPLRYLYAGAVAVVLPSLEEGFGLPAVEGAACGTPCIATANSPLPDLLRGGGLFVEPTDVAALADAMRRLLGSTTERRSLGAVALERARRLDWRQAAVATATALNATRRG